MSEIAKMKPHWIFHKQITRFVNFTLPRIPKWCETNHLTYMTIFWSILAIASAHFSLSYPLAIFGIWIAIFLQGVTDILDWALGRYRKTWLIKRWFYMDHFLDQVFLFSVLYSIYVVLPESGIWLIHIWIIWSLFFLHTFLVMWAWEWFNLFQWALISPNEVRYIWILWIIIIHMYPQFVTNNVQILVILWYLWLIYIIYVAQKNLRNKDMKIKWK